AGQLTSAGNDEGAYTFTYNELGQVIGVTEPFGVSLAFGYDAAGNRVLVHDSFGGTTSSTYNAADELVAEQFSLAGTPLLGITQTFNTDGHVISQTRANGDGSVMATTTDTYDGGGNLTDMLY